MFSVKLKDKISGKVIDDVFKFEKKKWKHMCNYINPNKETLLMETDRR